jgi:cytoskeletal protein CcmA (bactofilin family)
MALTGRVPVNVSLINGPIEAGDPLTSSSIPGMAMKATEPGNIIGTALESYDGTQASNQIMVQLHVGFDDPTADSGQLQGDQSINGDLTVSGNTALQGSMTINGGISVAGNSTMNSLMVGNTLNVDGNLTVNGTAAINNLESQSANISGQFSAGNSTLASLLIANDLTVNGNITVNGTATISNLNVSGSTSTQNLVVSGTTSLAGDIHLTGNVNTRQAIIKTFTASGPIAAGNAVIIDNTPGNEGDVTTTTTPGDPRVIGVAVTAAASPGDTVQVAIGGWVQVQVDTSADVNGNPPPPITPGQLIVTSGTAGTIQASANPAAGSILGKSTSNQDPNNLVWIIITLQ